MKNNNKKIQFNSFPNYQQEESLPLEESKSFISHNHYKETTKRKKVPGPDDIYIKRDELVKLWQQLSTT